MEKRFVKTQIFDVENLKKDPGIKMVEEKYIKKLNDPKKYKELFNYAKN